jgi:hypothetical protein
MNNVQKTLLQITLGISWIGGWVGHRAGLDAVAKRKLLDPATGNQSRSLRQKPVTLLTEL